MSKRRDERVGRTRAARRRNGAKDLSARKARRVVGGLLPAVRPEPRLAQGQAVEPTKQMFNYQKLEMDQP